MPEVNHELLDSSNLELVLNSSVVTVHVSDPQHC